jgi:GH25 family lysozyme M1 (1,4-beta-N-acetylmuramidase)
MTGAGCLWRILGLFLALVLFGVTLKGTAAADTGGFVYLKATEGTGYVDPDFVAERDAALAAGLLVGAYHFALPNRSSGAAQAAHLVANGGHWTADGRTLPATVDLEHNPYGQSCYGLTPAAMVAWIRNFSDAYTAAAGRAPVIYTPTGWWNQCTGGNAGFGTNPLWATGTGALPPGWTTPTFRQTPAGDVFNGTREELLAFAIRG